MRLALLSLLLSASAASAAPPPPDLVLVWEEGEMSLDMSMSRTEITVTGTKVHFATTYMGRSEFNKPHAADGTVKDPKKLAAALAALDKAKVVTRADDHTQYSGQVIEACLTRGKTTRCVSHRADEQSTAELDAITAVHDAALEGFPLSAFIGP